MKVSIGLLIFAFISCSLARIPPAYQPVNRGSSNSRTDKPFIITADLPINEHEVSVDQRQSRRSIPTSSYGTPGYYESQIFGFGQRPYMGGSGIQMRWRPRELNSLNSFNAFQFSGGYPEAAWNYPGYSHGYTYFPQMLRPFQLSRPYQPHQRNVGYNPTRSLYFPVRPEHSFGNSLVNNYGNSLSSRFPLLPSAISIRSVEETTPHTKIMSETTKPVRP
ncbi:uncharacterized protein LOC136027258 [Artemia franciscana]|uniref:uncharacterized protein LOC136027258 n=1 Tax=Artemia franciscana TaxID=6661 RepID=UPI0032DBC254